MVKVEIVDMDDARVKNDVGDFTVGATLIRNGDTYDCAAFLIGELDGRDLPQIMTGLAVDTLKNSTDGGAFEIAKALAELTSRVEWEAKFYATEHSGEILAVTSGGGR